MKIATRTLALGRVEAERHQADGLRAYSSIGESLHKKKKRNEASRGQKKMLHIHFCPSSKERGLVIEKTYFLIVMWGKDCERGHRVDWKDLSTVVSG
jgi:hypothetical protein